MIYRGKHLLPKDPSSDFSLGEKPSDEGSPHGSYQGPQILLTECELAARWQKSPRTLQNLRVSGRGPPFLKLGRTVRYQLAVILEIEAAAVRTSTSDGGRDA